MAPSKQALTNIKEASVCSAPRDEKERSNAKALLALVLEHFTEEEIINNLTIPQGKEFLEDTMTRFLRARAGNTKKSLAMIIEAMNFRKEFLVNQSFYRPLPEEVVEHINRHWYTGYLPGFDKFGRPAMVIRGGDNSRVLQKMWSDKPKGFEVWGKCDVEDVFLHLHIIEVEYLTKIKMKEASARAGKTISKYIILDDLRNSTISGFGAIIRNIGLFKKMTYIDQLLYPETLGGFFWINSPIYFQKPFQAISSLLDPETRKKVFVLGGSDSYQVILDEAFDKEDLPREWGGSLDGNHISSKENPNTPFFDKLQAHCNALLRSSGTGYRSEHRKNTMKSVKLKPQEKQEIEIALRSAGVVEWQLHSDTNDIEYSVQLKKDDGCELDTIQAPSKISSSVPRLNGQYVHKDSTEARIVFTFRNPRAHFKSRTLNYRFMVLQNSCCTGA